MGRYTAHCPKCGELISFRDEHTQWAKWLDEEYERGYQDGKPSTEYERILADNISLHKELDSLISRPEIRVILDHDKRDEEEFINSLIAKYKKESDNDQDTTPVTSSPPTSARVDT